MRHGRVWYDDHHIEVAPKQIARLNDLCMAGKLQEAQRLAVELDEIMTAAFLDTGPIPNKCMMKLMGLMPTNEHRLPMVPATPEQEQQLEVIVKRYSLFVKRTAFTD